MGNIAKGGILPNGEFTRSDRKYVADWRRFGACVVRGLEIGGERDFYVGGFDPGVLLIRRKSTYSVSLEGPVSMALARIGGWEQEQ